MRRRFSCRWKRSRGRRRRTGRTLFQQRWHIGRLVGAFRHCGLTEQASRLAADLNAAGLEFTETNRPVFIRGSGHVPPPHEAVPELLDTLFALLTAESSAGVQAVLGHFLFVYIHPYSDGNGRIGRFILNALAASAELKGPKA